MSQKYFIFFREHKGEQALRAKFYKLLRSTECLTRIDLRRQKSKAEIRRILRAYVHRFVLVLICGTAPRQMWLDVNRGYEWFLNLLRYTCGAEDFLFDIPLLGMRPHFFDTLSFQWLKGLALGRECRIGLVRVWQA